MPLDVARLRDSELASSETPEACWAAVLLWAASWHQIPAASIPNDEKWIAKTAGYALRGKVDKAWKDVRVGALRGWIECDDGRLYHPVVAEKARDAWQAKLKQRWMTECGRIKKHNDRHEGANVQKPTLEAWLAAGCPVGQPLHVPRDTFDPSGGQAGETASNRQGEGQGHGERQGQGTTSAPDGAGGAAAAAPAAVQAMTPLEAVAVMHRQEGAPLLEEHERLLWTAGRAIFLAAGVASDIAGKFIGKLIKDNGNDRVLVFDVMRAACLERPADPRGWMVAACQQRRGQRVSTNNRQTALEDSNLAAAATFAGN